MNFTQLEQVNGQFHLKEVYIPRESVKILRDSTQHKNLLKEGYLPPSLHPNHEFTEVLFHDGSSIIVVSSLSAASHKLGQKSGTVLRD